MANGTQWKIVNKWKTRSGYTVIQYENDFWECRGVIYPHKMALIDAIGPIYE